MTRQELEQDIKDIERDIETEKRNILDSQKWLAKDHVRLAAAYKALIEFKEN